MFRQMLLWPSSGWIQFYQRSYSFSDKIVVDVDKLYTPDNIAVLRLLYPYRIVTLGSNKHNGDDDP